MTIKIDDDILYINDRPYLWAITRVLESPVPEIEIHTRQGLLPFESGWELSIIWGSYTYSDNYHAHHHRDFWGFGEDQDEVYFLEEVSNVEIAVIYGGETIPPPDASGEEMLSNWLVWPSHDSVLGWVHCDNVERLIDVMAEWPSDFQKVQDNVDAYYAIVKPDE